MKTTEKQSSHPIFEIASQRPLTQDEVQTYIRARAEMGKPLPKDEPKK
jgi:hypothetical protein